MSAFTGMLSAIDRNHCPPSNGMPVRHHRNTHTHDDTPIRREKDDRICNGGSGRAEPAQPFKFRHSIPPFPSDRSPEGAPPAAVSHPQSTSFREPVFEIVNRVKNDPKGS